MNHLKLAWAFLFLLLLGFSFCRALYIPSPVSAFSTGPPAGRSGAPDEATCFVCHNTYPLNHPSGGIRLEGLPKNYTPGEPIEFNVTVLQDGTPEVRKNWGFEMTVVDAQNAFVGTWVATDSENTQVIKDDDPTRARMYIEHTLAGTFFNPQGADHATWTVTWVPPDADAGLVIFYAAGNAGNGNGQPSGDYIFTTGQVVAGPE